MNERIKELITQAGGHWNYGDFNMPSSVEFQEEDIAKFAEPIVRECVATVAFHRRADTPHEYDDLDEVDRAVDNIVSEICGRLHTKFGVR